MIGTNNAILEMAKAMAQHAASRQSVVSQNLAHLNTPGYRQMAMPSFADVVKGRERAEARVDSRAVPNPNGNSVSLETQLEEMASTRGEHEMALGLWEQTLALYKTAMGAR
ncbi:hypothetical protein PB2503_07949 [Parvularcula bermudensis HTCC2503]|uniref:Flagellar basal body rod protein FlgB n=1 Tax=Parvularcula bermudensis (strain ATCC BAA-594 / HTCC2503 / KCTC 12087) TaxID=314260 RepID=E0TH61_PARBH|nr:hypothetical protein [Parvularcula bermudensis]ADM09645.1 hypothetical protein PB2503_07949 [Parvularcula bermudensis HTCC2503]